MDLAGLSIRYSDRPTIEAKIVVVGSLGCGKTSLVLRQMYKNCDLPNRIASTIGLTFLTSHVVLQECLVRLQLWDTAGQERFRAMGPMYFRHANVALIVYDISSEQSFREAMYWVAKLDVSPIQEDDVILCVIANKLDLEADRKISTEMGRAFANENGALFFETSALEKTGGVEQAFTCIGTKLFKRHEKRCREKEEMRQAQKQAGFAGRNGDTRPVSLRLGERKSCQRSCCP